MIHIPAKIGVLAFVLIGMCGTSATQAEDLKLIGRVSISGTEVDLSGQADLQEDGTPQNRLGGHGSGICWLGKGNRYVMLPDRGPADGATSYRCRIQIVEINVNPEATPPVTTKLLETHLLVNADGKPFVGRSSQFDQAHPEKSLRMDPEGIRATPQGTLLISEEYGPTVREFDLKGKWIRDLPTPDHYRIAFPNEKAELEMPPHNQSGRQNNRGWEGVAISVDGTKTYSILQNPLLQDGAVDDKNSRIGLNVRIWEYNLTNGESREFLYPLESKSLGCSDIEAISPDRLLVIERESTKAGAIAKFKRIYEIDLSKASDIWPIKNLPTNEIHAGVTPVAKKLYLDLLAPQHGLAGKSFPDKIEGIAMGPQLKDGSRVFIVTSDNDFKAEEATEIFAFAVPK